MKESTEKISYKVILKQKEYMKMILAALVNRFGDSVDAIASAWIVYELTNNAAWSAIIFGVNKLPSVLITPLAGAWVESRNKKRIMVITDLLRGACVAFVATGYLLGFLQAWMLIITTVIISTAEAFRGPAGTALTPKILEKQYYEYAMSLMSTLSTVVELIGTAMAGGIIALLGTAGAIYIDMATFLLSAFIIMLMHTKEESSKKRNSSVKNYAETLKEGIDYVKRNNIVRFFIGLSVFLNAVLVPFNSLQAPLAEEILRSGAEILSVMGIALTIGMMLGSIVYPVIRQRLSGKAVVFLGGVCIGLYYIGLIACKPLYELAWFRYGFVAVMSGLFGLFIMLLMAFMQIEFIKSVEEEYLARASAILTAFGSAATPITSFLVGAITVFISTELVFIVTGSINIFVCLLLLRSKALRQITTAESVNIATEERA